MCVPLSHSPIIGGGRCNGLRRIAERYWRARHETGAISRARAYQRASYGGSLNLGRRGSRSRNEWAGSSGGSQKAVPKDRLALEGTESCRSTVGDQAPALRGRVPFRLFPYFTYGGRATPCPLGDARYQPPRKYRHWPKDGFSSINIEPPIAPISYFAAYKHQRLV